MSNKSFGFGAGVLWATPAGANPTPVKFGTLQDGSVDFSFTTKKLTGQYQFPVAIGRGVGSIMGKAHFANISSDALNAIFFGQTAAVGQNLVAVEEAGTIPGTPFQVTVANGATFDADLGVSFVTTGLPLTRVAAAPATGQYAVNTATGVYTFAAADTTKLVLISYSYTQAVTGKKATITNQLLGTAVTFQVDLYQTNPNVAGAQWSLRLFSCLSSKLTLATKLEDFTIPEFDFEAFANASNQIGVINTAE